MRDRTKVTTLGREPHENFGIVNPPTYRASTVLYPTLDALRSRRNPGGTTYGRYGTPTTLALEAAIAELEGGAEAVAVGSGKTAIGSTLLALLTAGDHMLVADTVYGPTRRLAEGLLKRFGVTTTFYDPAIGAGIAGLMRPETKLVFAESPGSWTFEMQDIPAIAEAAHAHGALVLADNTWGSPLYCKPLALGADLSIQAATKYVGGHSDLMMGIVTMRRGLEQAAQIRHEIYETASASGPDDCYLALRGLRTLAVRLPQHWQSGVEVARWLQARPEVTRVMHPALPEDPGHALWRRDCSGASGLFGFVLDGRLKNGLAAMLDRMALFGMGYSWGGYESLLVPTEPANLRTAVPWSDAGQAMRIHIGLEDPADLIGELEAGFERLNRAA